MVQGVLGFRFGRDELVKDPAVTFRRVRVHANRVGNGWVVSNVQIMSFKEDSAVWSACHFLYPEVELFLGVNCGDYLSRAV